jgi:hypothetical protein
VDTVAGMKKFLLALQVWEGDIKDGESLCKVLLRLAPENGYKAADLALVTRFDCRKFSTRLVQDLQEVFGQVLLFTSPRKETGYPGGCNGLWHGTIQWVAESIKRGEMDYSSVLTTEADACPLVGNWDVQLQQAWEERQDSKIVGYWHPSPCEPGHVNGNALFEATLFNESVQLWGCDANQPWDVYHARLFERLGWKGDSRFYSMWQTPTVSADFILGLVRQGTVWLHGIKDSSVRDWVSQHTPAKTSPLIGTKWEHSQFF